MKRSFVKQNRWFGGAAIVESVTCMQLFLGLIVVSDSCSSPRGWSSFLGRYACVRIKG